MSVNPKILLVEDNDIDKELFEYLCSGKYDITWVKTLKEAKEILSSENKFDCLVIDLRLPDSTFPNTILEIQKLSKDQPMVVLTGMDEKELIIGKGALERIYKYILKYRDNTSDIIQSTIDGAIKKRATNGQSAAK